MDDLVREARGNGDGMKFGPQAGHPGTMNEASRSPQESIAENPSPLNPPSTADRFTMRSGQPQREA